MPANTQPFPWVRCWATGTMSLLRHEAAKSYILVLVSYPTAPAARSCQNGLLRAPAPYVAEPCQRLEGLWLPVMPACRQQRGL